MVHQPILACEVEFLSAMKKTLTRWRVQVLFCKYLGDATNPMEAVDVSLPPGRMVVNKSFN